MNDQKLSKLIFAAMSAALIFLGTYFLRIPSFNGYIHLGDGFLCVAAAIQPLHYALGAAAVGGALSDLLAGYAVYIPATAVCKALMALTVGLLMRKVEKRSGKSSRTDKILTFCAAIAGAAVNVVGYYLAETIMYGTGGAIASLGPNAVQSSAGAAVFLLLLPMIDRAMKRFGHKF